ncbi:pyrroline-5-carboxylate reductase [Acanthocheilonema viteae]
MSGDPESVENGSTDLQKLLAHTTWEPKLTFIGGGKIAAALICGFESAGLVTKDDVAVSVKTALSVQRWKRLGYVNVYTSNEFLIRAHGQGIVFLSVKPQMRTAVLEELSNKAFTNTPLIVSVMCGVDVKTLEKEVVAKGYASERGVVRLMTNLPVSMCSGASIICSSLCLEEEKIDLIKSIMQYVGICFIVNEKSFNAAAAIAGCGPAFMFMAIEALSDGGVLGGIDRTTAMKLAAQAVMGAARMVLEASEHPAALKDDVCSAGGSTIYGVKELEKNGFRSALIEAVYASTKRSSEQA